MRSTPFRARSSGARRPAAPALALVLLALGAPSLQGQAGQLTPLGALQAISGSDDSYVEVQLTDVFPTGIRFGANVYTSMYIGTNGYVTFGHGNSSFSPLGIAGYTGGPMVAAQYDDIHPGISGDIHYNQNAASGYVVASWVDVAPYNTPTASGNGVNSFQIALRTLPDGDPQDFRIEIRYQALNWAGAAINGGAFPTAGWTAGDQATFQELPRSGQSTFRTSASESNIGQAGVYRWDVEGGVVQGPPLVSATAAVTGITASAAVSGGTVSGDGGSEVTARGIVWNTVGSPTLADASATSGSGTGSFTADLTGLSHATTYHVRAFATNANGTTYGPQRSFATPNQVPQAITFPALQDRVYGGGPFLAGASASSELTVSYTSSNPAVATVSGDTVRITGAGTTVITASQAGNGSWLPADPVQQTLTVTPKPITGSFTVAADRSYDGTTDMHVTGRFLHGVEAMDEGEVELQGGEARLASPDVGKARVVTLTGASLTGARAAHYVLTSVATTTTDVIPGPLADFLVEAATGGPIGTQVADSTFRVRITARDAFGNVVEEFEGTVELTSTGGISAGAVTAAFDGGILESHEVAIPEAGTQLLSATGTHAGRTRSGTSLPFLVELPAAHVAISVVASSREAAPGSDLQLTVTVVNLGSHPALDVQVPDPLEGHERLERLGAEADQGTVDPAGGSWSVGRLEPGQQATLRIQARVVNP